MNLTLIIVLFSQLLFTSGDLLARSNMSRGGFKLSTFISSWFVIYVLLRSIATLGQLYVFTQSELGRTMTMFGVAGIILANILGFIILKEQLSFGVYIGIVIGIIALLIVGFSK